MAGQLSAMLESFRKKTEPARDQIEKWQGEFNSYARKRTEQLYRTVLASPAVFVLLLIVIAAFLGQRGLDFQAQIEDDVEIFLPDGAESTDLLLEVREEWSTDIAVIYIQTDNARLGGGLGDNITDEKILREISWIEGDDDNIGGSNVGRGMDFNKGDYGEIDGVLWIISPAQIMKEINSTDGRFNASMCEHAVNTRIPVDFQCENARKPDCVSLMPKSLVKLLAAVITLMPSRRYAGISLPSPPSMNREPMVKSASSSRIG